MAKMSLRTLFPGVPTGNEACDHDAASLKRFASQLPQQPAALC